MASRRTYPCFQCGKGGHEVQVFLDGKDEQGRTKYLNEDGTKHTHLESSSSQQQKEDTTTTISIADLALQVKLLHQKVDRVIHYLDKREV